MEPLVIIIPHKLGKDEALRRLKPALGTAAQNFPVLKVEQEIWSDDRLDFRVRALGQAAAGNVEVGGESVRLEVTLPWLLHKFAEVVQKTITGRARILLDTK
jgi:Putative polyhydroxyalkanoic acid system protein (PHA_gran_rgn)